MESDCAASFGPEAEGVDPTLFLGMIYLRLRNKIGKEFHGVLFVRVGLQSQILVLEVYIF